MTHWRIAFLGYGTVARALHALLDRHRDTIDFEVTGIGTRSTGLRDIDDWLADARPDVVFEAIALDPSSGQPALDYLRAALEYGAHAISANKGPIVYGYRELTSLAERAGRKYRFESAVMDGAPVFSLARECLPLAGLRGVSGIFTSTATVVLEAIEQGMTLDEGIARAQQLGIAEADPAYDVDGLDTAVKLCALANVLLDGDLRPADVEREGLRELPVEEVRRAAAEGRPYRLVGEVRRDSARVAPRQCENAVRGTTLVTHFEADMFPGGLSVTSHDPDPTTTAYGMFADFVTSCLPARAPGSAR